MISENFKKEDIKFFFCSFDFLNDYLPTSGMSKNTITTYKKSLLSLGNFWEYTSNKSMSEFMFSDCTRDFLLEFINWLSNEKKVKASTIANRLAAIKSYTEFAKYKDPSIIQFQLEIKSVKAPKSIKVEKFVLSEDQIEKILSEIENTEKGLRNKTLLTLLYESACRITELLTLKLNNVFIEQSPYIKILGKGKKERVIPISDKMKELLQDYIKHFHSTYDNDALLFYSNYSGIKKEINTRTVELMLKKYADKAREKDPSIPKDIYPHAFRRSRATNLYNNGMDFTSVSTFMGHSQLETTKIYCKPSVDKMRQEINKASNEINTSNPNYDWKDKSEIIKKFFGN